MSCTADRGVLITGFPGFIAERLFERLIDDRPEANFYLLVEARFAFVAQKRCAEIESRRPELAGRWHVVLGDICESGLGIDQASRLHLINSVTEVWHLAALYDLSAAQSASYAINVEGTDRVLDFCESLSDLRRLHYISTCYVCGDRTGRVYEDELDERQDFKNHYEATKCWAEGRVQARWDRIPTTIFRPAVVVGDSTTGEAVKGDGPYVLLQLLLRLPRWVPMVHIGPSQAPVNLVPVDFVVEAMARISSRDDTAHSVFQLADPTPRTARELVDLSIDHLGRAPAIATVPAGVKPLLGPVQAWSGMPPASIDYFNHEVQFDVSNTAAALGDTLHCPKLDDYWGTIIDYAAANRHILSAGVR